MENLQFEESNQDEDNKGGFCQQMCGALFMAICIAPLIIIGSCFLLGWNERNVVCNDRAFDQVHDVAKEVSCTQPITTYQGELVAMNCDITSGAMPLASLGFGEYSSVGSGSNTPYYGVEAKADIYQCIETKKSSTQKLSNGKTQTVNSFTYAFGWGSTVKQWENQDPVCPCGMLLPVGLPPYNPCGTGGTTYKSNQPLPTGLITGQKWVDIVVFGNGGFKIEDANAIHKIPILTPLSWSTATAPAGYTASGNYLYKSPAKTSVAQIGDVRITVSTTVSGTGTPPKISALFQNSPGGVIGPGSTWLAKATWLCGQVGILRYDYPGKSKVDTVLSMKGENNAIMWVIRILGFGLLWFALTRFFGPLGVCLDFVPCIGPFLNDMMEVIVCVCSCPPACGCCLCVAGIVWVAMRPMIGIPMMLIWCCVVAGMGGAKYHMMQKNKNAGDLEGQS